MSEIPFIFKKTTISKQIAEKHRSRPKLNACIDIIHALKKLPKSKDPDKISSLEVPIKEFEKHWGPVTKSTTTQLRTTLQRISDLKISIKIHNNKLFIWERSKKKGFKNGK